MFIYRNFDIGFDLVQAIKKMFGIINKRGFKISIWGGVKKKIRKLASVDERLFGTQE